MLQHVTESERSRKRATYEDLLKLPEHLVAEIIDGELYVSPRPAFPHAEAASLLRGELHQLQHNSRWRGGWKIVYEPELHFGDDVLVPDLAGWRLPRMPEPHRGAFSTVAPDWVCEVLSPSTARLDRAKKVGVYAREGVSHVWLLDPIAKTLEVLVREGSRLIPHATHGAHECVHVVPFDTLAIELAYLWGEPPDTTPH